MPGDLRNSPPGPKVFPLTLLRSDALAFFVEADGPDRARGLLRPLRSVCARAARTGHAINHVTARWSVGGPVCAECHDPSRHCSCHSAVYCGPVSGQR